MNKELQDKAWAVLPKEFRKEVKDIFLSSPHIGMMRILVDIFGYDNIIHNTETEEMLIVSRGKVQDLYRAAKSNKDSDDINIAEERYCDGKIETLKALFGSVCLPDEVVSNVANKPQSESNNDETYFLAPRLQVAAAAMQGMLGNPNLTKEGHLNENRGYIAEYAVEYADVLLQKLGINYENK